MEETTFCQCFCGFVCPRLPGDSRTKIGFITFDSTIHFYNLQEGLSQPQMLIVSDIEGEVDLTVAPTSFPGEKPVVSVREGQCGFWGL